MRIVHISTGTIGGAGIVAHRIATMQRIAGHEVHLISLNKSENNHSEEPFERPFFLRIKSRTNTVISLLASKKKWTQITATSVSAHSLFQIEQIDPDVIHIHNWFNMLSHTDIKVLNQKYPIVFHIHDARLMTGGCHFTLDCSLHNKGCVKCPATHIMRPLVRESFLLFEKMFYNSAPYGIIFPSLWLEKEFKNSAIYVNSTINTRCIAPLDLNVIDGTRPEIRNGVLCVISNLGARVKGFDLFLDSIEILRNKGVNTHVNIVGGHASASQIERMHSLEISYLGPLPSLATLQIISEAELIVIPSYSENSPTVVLEAQLLKTCVLVTSIDGCLELVEDSKTGYVCETNPFSMSEGIERALAGVNNDKLILEGYIGALRKIENISETIIQTYSQVITKFKEAL